MSRNGNDVTGAYPELRALDRALGSHAAILDGEIVAFDETGHPSFEALQPRMHVRGEAAVRRLAHATPVTYVLFDLLWLDGHSLMDLPYIERQERLRGLELEDERWRTPEFEVGGGSALLAATREQGLEGVVAKRLDSPYVPGGRHDGWLKIKHSNRQEFAIGGWTEGKGARSQRIGALHLGAYDDQGLLRYAGRVGTGFDSRSSSVSRTCLGHSRGTTRPLRATNHRVALTSSSPGWYARSSSREWTKDGPLRHPSYKGLREDKPRRRWCVSGCSRPKRASPRLPVKLATSQTQVAARATREAPPCRR